MSVGNASMSVGNASMSGGAQERFTAREFFRDVAGTFVSGVALATVAALGEALFLWSAQGDFHPATLGLSLGLFLPLGAVLGLFVGLLLASFSVATRELGLRAGDLRDDSTCDHYRVSLLLSACTAAAIQFFITLGFATGPASVMANRNLAAQSTALVAVAASAMSALLFFPLRHAFKAVSARIPRTASLSRLGLVLIVLVVFVALAGLAIGSRLDWRVLHSLPWACIVALILGTFIGARYFTIRRLRAKMVWLAIVLTGMGAAIAPFAGRSAPAITIAQEKGVLTPMLIGAARRLSDGDGDGYAASFNGGDCQDDNPAVHPGARDIPGNGVDENCRGGDAISARPVLKNRPEDRQPADENRRLSAGGNAALNFLILCIDTLRADALGELGRVGGESRTPNLDALARRSVLFTQAYAQAANTPQSFPSIFTSRYPSTVPFERKFVGYPELGKEAVSVFEALHDVGYRTLAQTSHFYFSEGRGIRQGFDHWNNEGAKTLRRSNKDIASPRIVPRAIATLNAQKEQNTPFALFVHLFEPHSTYMKHPGVRYRKRGSKGLREKYDEEVRYVDHWVGKLLEALRESSLASRTVVVVFADHGEAFGEHGFYFHGQALYQEVIHVPLIVAIPGGKPRRIDTGVALLDLAPTLTDLAKIDLPATFQGRSLVPLIRGESSGGGDRPLGAVLLPYPAWPKGQRAAVFGRYKVIQRIEENRFEVYDLQRDSREKTNLVRSDPQRAQELISQFDHFSESVLDAVP